MSTSLTPGDWIGLFTHFTALSLLAVGGVITTVPDMQRYLVADQHWLTDSQFTSSVALAQAAPELGRWHGDGPGDCGHALHRHGSAALYRCRQQ